jgi:hypothetical protein
VQDAAVEVVEVQGGELAPAGAGVSGKAHQEQIRLGMVPPASGRGGAGVVGDSLQHRGLGGGEKAGDLIVGERASRFKTAGAAHGADRMGVDDPLVIRPADRSAQDPEPPADHAVGRALGLPAGEGLPQLVRSEADHSSAGEMGVAAQVTDVGLVADPGRRLPRVVGLQPRVEELANGQQRRGAGPASVTCCNHCLPAGVGLRGGAVDGDRPLQGAPGGRVGAHGDADLPHPRASFAHRP